MGTTAQRWLWPLAIDLSIAQSTLALLALTAAPRRTYVAPTRHNGAQVMHHGFPLHSLAAPVGDWAAAADELIGAGVTRLGRDKLAAVLAELADGTAPSAIARKFGVGYATVARIGNDQTPSASGHGVNRDNRSRPVILRAGRPLERHTHIHHRVKRLQAEA